jgi:hypothetical protein
MLTGHGEVIPLSDLEGLLRVAAVEASRGRSEGARRALAAAVAEGRRVSDRLVEASDDIELWMAESVGAILETRSAL